MEAEAQCLGDDGPIGVDGSSPVGGVRRSRMLFSICTKPLHANSVSSTLWVQYMSGIVVKFSIMTRTMLIYNCVF